ncbi:MAG TPA: amino acid adenylation domain-containing protein, partial [Longimicrobium sp.]|nr:amino acid adenylation domain-containing protein [Longimicrobium sp.]
MVVALLGVLKAGGAYIPLDPAYPPARLGAMIEDAGIRLVLTTTSVADRLPAGAAEPICLDALRDRIASHSAAAPESGVRPENLSHVIFTSGSTGRPKGVMIRHSSTAALLHWMRENVADEERAAVLASTSISFDVSVAEIFGALCWGGTLVLVENALELPTVADPPIRYASMVPTAAAELLRAGGFPAGLLSVNLAGEPLPADLAQALYALGTVRTVRNLYGPTEDTSYSTCSVVPRGADRVLIGRPLANSRAYVLDDELREAPVGVPGELYLAGDGLARGYQSRPGLTAERFLPDRSGPAGARMYRTMDRARWTADGELEYLGRADVQVKVRGFRIEPEEVETALRTHASIRDAVVVAREDTPGDRRLVAYVVAGDDVPSAAELRARLRERLPDYMVPSAFVTLDALPRTGSGKVDRGALPAPDAPTPAGSFVAPRTPVEELLAGIFAEMLEAERVGVHDDFFDAGGHSLLAMRDVTRVQAAFGVEVSVRALFETPTVAGLAARVDALRRAGTPADALPLRAALGEGPRPLSFAQRRLWLLDQMEPGRAAYNLAGALRIRGPLDVAALEGSLTDVVRRHEALRTRFATVAGEPVQVVDPAGPVRIPLIDLAEDAAREATLRALAAEEAWRPFNLQAGPLLRSTLVRLRDGEHALLFTMHHVISDGWSIGVLVREVSELYAARTEERAPVLPFLPVQYADYAAWQRARLTGDALDAQLGWWRETLAGAPPRLELPTDRPRPALPGEGGAVVQWTLSAETTRALGALSRREGATLFMTLLAAWQLLLSRYSGQDDVCVGTPVAGRDRVETEALIGFFVNTLVLRGDLSGDPSFRELLGRAREAALGAYAHQEMPFEMLVEALQPVRSRAHSPFFQVMLSLQNAEGASLRLGAAEVEAMELDAHAARFDLSFALAEDDGALRGRITYRTELFDAGTVERMLAHYT